MTTNVDIIVKHFGTFRKLAEAIGVSHTAIMTWRNKDGEFPARYNAQIRDAALRLSREKAASHEWGDKEVRQFMTAVDNCLQPDVCPTCGKPT